MRCGSRLERRAAPLATVAVVGLMCSATAFAVDSLDFPASSQFDILDGAGAKVIGHARYDLQPAGPRSFVLYGENRFLDGQYDIEEDQVRQGGPDESLNPIAYRHDYFGTDGSLQRFAQADFTTGDASCAVYVDGRPQVNRAKLEFPSDTYGGSTVVIPLTRGLREGFDRPIHFHNFNCVPGPRILSIEAHPPSVTRWSQYPGDLVQVRLKPDFGWLGMLIAPFVPRMDAWFEPSRPWAYVGGKAGRYYKGPEIVLVRVRKESR